MRFHYLLLALLLAAPMWASAQESAAVRSARAHFQATSSVSFAASDLGDLAAIDQHVDSRSGATMVYMTQRHAGIPIYGSVSAAAVTPAGKVIAVRPAFQTGIASRVNSTTPSVYAYTATERAKAHVSAILPNVTVGGVPVLSDDAATDNKPVQPRTPQYDATEPELVYATLPSGELRLSWSVTLSTETGLAELWAVRVDALTGEVIGAEDLVARHSYAPANQNKAREAISFAPIASSADAMPFASLQQAGAYRVIPWPNESPNHGAFALVTSPANATASPNGWHSTGTANFTTTRGNNVWAYEDRDNTNSPSAISSSPDGRAGLSFDFPFDPSKTPLENIDASVTNLFYWTNIFHDVTWFYGFDEAAGNFQAVNASGAPGAGDPVRAEAQDKADLNPCPADVQCFNNANFSTPSDGGSGRMQMYEWTSAGAFAVNAPAAIAGEYPVSGAAFGLTTATVTGSAVVATGATTNGFSRGCASGDISNPGAIAGSIALIERGGCDFIAKARVAQSLGASAVVIYNCSPKDADCSATSEEQLVTMALPDGATNDVTILARFVQMSTGHAIRESPVPVNATVEALVSRDSGLDAGVILHEHAHGISNRLTGGRTQAGCLGNVEQMGEGWSDYFGLIMTMKPSDTASQLRGVATYLEFEDTDGIGIRNTPYTTDFAVNDYTYQDVISFGGATTGARRLSVPHGVGFAWNTMLWEMTWDLIAAHGFDADIYNASGSAGNQIALNLVTMGLKLQPCSPGFVDGRDAILAADIALYNGAHQQTIWNAFARRGLGANARQGLSTSTSDGTADFTAPTIATEQTATGGTVSLTVAGPNPFRSATTMALSLDQPQDVRVVMIDLLGREVSVLHHGALAADIPHELSVVAGDLPSGVYVVRATGDSFTVSERVTIAR